MRKKKKIKATKDSWSKELILPVMLLWFVVLFRINGKEELSAWFALFAILTTYIQRKHISLRTTFEGIAYMGGYTLVAAVAMFIAPWSGRYGPREREDSYPVFAFGILFAAIGYGLREIIIRKKLNQASQTTSARRRA